MLFTAATFLLLVVASTVSVSAAPSAPVSVVQERSLISTLLGSSCPKGYTYGSVTNKGSFNTSMKNIKPTVDSYFDGVWEGESRAGRARRASEAQTGVERRS